MGVYKIADVGYTAEDNTTVYINCSGGYMTHPRSKRVRGIMCGQHERVSSTYLQCMMARMVTSTSQFQNVI